MFYQFHKRLTTLLLLSVLFLSNFEFVRSNPVELNDWPVYSNPGLYDVLELSQKGLDKEVFKKAIVGWNQLKKNDELENSALLSIVDLSQSCNSKRLYVIDMDKKTVCFTTYVSHGRGSGEEFANTFGNAPDSYKSSLGFYVTGPTYIGSHGLSMKLKGLETGTNNLAEQRGIVMHGASYVSEAFIQQNGRLGRSLGCPAVPEKECAAIVNKIKEGSCFFIFYPDSTYLRNSAFL